MPSPRTCLIVLAASGLACAPAGAATARPRLVQSVAMEVPLAPVPVKIAGRPHLVYELHVTNFQPYDVTLKQVEVRDAARGTLVTALRGSRLRDSLGRPGVPRALPDAHVVGAGLRAVVYLWLRIEEGTPVPARLRHGLEADLARPEGLEPIVVEGGECGVRTEAPVVLGPPLRGGRWAALYDPALARGHRTTIYTLEGRARIPARFAIDWVRLDEDGTRARGDAALVSNWHGYGAEVLAVADAVVAAAMDDLPEHSSLQEATRPIPLENASGNSVTLDLGGGRYAFYEHLRPGSVRVKRGDRVKAGQVLALLGNSGSSSSGPHLHFHVADASSELAAEGVPYVFRDFEVVGAFETIASFAGGARWGPAPAGAGGRRRMELPAPNSVVVF